MEISAASSILHSPFSDQTHLQFYGHGSCSFTPAKLCFNTPFRSFPSLASKPLKAPLRGLCDSICIGPSDLNTEQILLMEIADLKRQMKQKKRELKSRMREDKAKVKMQLKDGKKMKERKDVQGGKAKIQSESSSSSSESSDEECESVRMKTLRGGSEVTGVDSRGIDSVCASGGIEVFKGFSSNVLSSGNEATESCSEESYRAFQLGRENLEISSSMPSIGGLLAPHKAVSRLEEFQVQSNICGAMSTCKSAPGQGFTSNAFSSCRDVSNRIEVCAGGKCKKAGSEQLLSALRGRIPVSLNVEAVPCKCMGKCSMGINVRVHKENTNPEHHSHVVIEDASIILGHHFGLNHPPMGSPCP